jgi:hypothetical protein
MGLRKESICLLMQEGLKQPFKGKITTLGRQDIWVTHQELEKLSQKLGYPLRSVNQIELSEKPEMRAEGFISDRTLFALLGFDQLQSLDASPYENADILFDLNQNELPAALKESSDVVLDPGTIEHVFHVANSLKNIFHLLKSGGRVIHISPSSNHLDHGFYMFSPTLFSDYYAANRFDLSSLKMIQYKPQPVFPWKIAAYSPAAFNDFSFGGLDHSMYAVYCVASKTPQSSFDQIPQQYHFAQNLWNQKTPTFVHSKLKKWIKSVPLFYKIALFFLRRRKQSRLQRKFTPFI